MPIPYSLIRSKRRSLSLQISKEGLLIARAPRLMPVFLIEDFIEKKRLWIEKNTEKIRSKVGEKKVYTAKEVKEMKGQLEEYIVPRVQEFWEGENLPKYTSIKITKSEGRWGSCSARNGLCFSYRLVESLEGNSDFIDAIIVHELAHLREKNHQKPFWNLVYRMMPQYKNIMKNRDIGE